MRGWASNGSTDCRRSAAAAIRMLPLFLLAAWLSACQAYDDTIIASSTARTAAIDYLAALPSGTKVFIWGGRMRLYESLDSDLLQASLNRYQQLRGNAFPLVGSARVVEVSVVPVVEGGYLPATLRKSRLLTGYRAVLQTARRSEDGCSAYLLTDRETWPIQGAVLVDEEQFPDASKLDECVHTALDFINGVPPDGEGFRYTSFPSVEARGAILAASRQCSSEGKDAPIPIVRTRDGITPLPSIDCMISKLGDNRSD